MTDDLKALVNCGSGEDPSDEFVADFRKQFLEAAGEKADADNGETYLVPTPRAETAEVTEPKNRWPFIAAAAAAIALVVLVGVGSQISRDGAPALETRDNPDNTPSTELDATIPPTTIEDPPAPTVVFPEPDAQPLISQALLEPDDYFLQTVGVELTMTFEEPRSVLINDGSTMRLSGSFNGRVDDRTLGLMRLSDLADPSTFEADEDSSWPIDDFDGWLDAADSGDFVAVANREATELFGFSAVRADLEVSSGPCRDEDSTGDGDERCLFGTNHLVEFQELRPGSTYRIWMVDVGDPAPLVIVAAIETPDRVDWFDRADAILSRTEVGAVGPNPILDTEVGGDIVELPGLGGIRVDVAANSFVQADTRGFVTVGLRNNEGVTDFFLNPLDTNGRPLETTDDLVAAMEAVRIRMREADGQTVDGQVARQFEFLDNVLVPPLRANAEDATGWFSPPRGWMWAIEHPDRGLIVIIAGLDEDPSSDILLSQAEGLLDTLEFVEPG